MSPKRRTRQELAEQLADAALIVLLSPELNRRRGDPEAEQAFKALVDRFLEII